MSPRPPTSASMHLYRHPEIQLGRPYAFDVDENGVLWEGYHSGLFTHDSRRGECRRLDPEILRDKVVNTAICFEDQIVTVHQIADHFTVYDPRDESGWRIQFPNRSAIVWYAIKAGGKLIMIDRSAAGGILIYDSLEKPPRIIPKTAPEDEFAAMRILDDGRVIMATANVVKILIFHPDETCFAEVHHSGDVNGSLTGSVLYDGKIYLADSAAGRILVYRIDDGQWLETIPTPDVGRIYGFIGGGFQIGSKGYFCLSTFRYPSRIDPQTGQMILPDDWNVGVDGKPIRFIDRFLIFDAATGEFDYLIAPPQPDGVLQLCYSHSVDGRAFISGNVMPYRENGFDPAGDWVIWQSFPVENSTFA